MSLRSKKINGLLVRIAITFVQGFSAVWAASGFRLDKVAIGGAVAAGLSVVYNLMLKPWFEKFNNIQGA